MLIDQRIPPLLLRLFAGRRGNGFKIIIHQCGPLSFSPQRRKVTADQKTCIGDRVFVSFPQIPIALFAERIGIQIDHMSVNEVIGGQTLQDPVDHPVSEMTGQGQQKVESPQRAHSFVDLFLRGARKIQ